MDSNGVLQMDQNLNDIFDIMPGFPTVIEHKTTAVSTDVKPVDDRTTFDFVQENLKDLAILAIETIDDLKAVASSSESPRAYEVLSTHIKTAADVLKAMLDNEKTQKDLSGEGDESGPTKSVTNNTIVVTGTMASLEDRIAEILEGNFEKKP